MADHPAPETTETTESQPLTIRISNELADKIEACTAATKLKKSPLLRLAIDRGLDKVLEQLECSVETTNTAAEA